ncbi:hypothetical protein [Phascolarctobacterium sp.]|uniref:hypothetical protein n=1 Tax=Phascolarctobacterium sp. TaxID=2049039 RepID=UPI0038678032
MSYYLIGIGGTGARCMEAFVHLNGAGLLNDKQPVKLVYVDADVSCGNLQRTQKAVEAYAKVQPMEFGDTGLFANAIDDYAPWSPVPENKKNLDEVLQRSGLANKNEFQPLGLLYDALFTKEERETSLDKGFRGHPAIGAAVMGSSMNVEEVEPWRSLMQKINIDKDAKIFLFASVFGGTGASGFPTIARVLQNLLSKVDTNGGQSVAKIGGALILPYFTFPPADDGSTTEMQAKVDDFILNTKSALNYYDNSDLLEKVFKSIYLIGDNDLTETGNFSLGSNTQKNDAHFIELYGALAAFDFFNKTDFSETETPMVARGSDGSGDTITWEDLPDRNEQFRARIKSYIEFLFLYQRMIYPQLFGDREIGSEQGFFTKIFGKKRQAWVENLVIKKGQIDLSDNTSWKNFDDLKDYADTFFLWLKQVCNNNRRDIQLIDKHIFDENNKFDDNMDIIIPKNETAKALSRTAITGELSAEKKKSVSLTGTGYLMSAIYDIVER